MHGGAHRYRWQTLGQTCSRGDPGSAICVQRLDDSLNSAIHTRYRSLLRSSSMHEPRDPPSEVVKIFTDNQHQIDHVKVSNGSQKKPKMGELGSRPGERGACRSRQFKCGTRWDAGLTPPSSRAGISPISSRQCTVFHRCRGCSNGQDLLMILPQVHLRKPCYDFYFL